MLVITRKSGEGFWIGDDIYIQVIEIRDSHGKIRIGIQAPKEVRVLREELLTQGESHADRFEETKP